MEESAVQSLYKKWWFWLIVLFVLTAMFNSGRFMPTIWQSGIGIPSFGAEYHEVFSFSGSGIKNSEPFTIRGERFKIAYECGSSDSHVLCQAFVYNTRSNLPQIVMNAAHATKDETVIYGSGEYYINANVIGNFTMTVYEYR